MNTYKKPEIEVVEFEIPDVITLSNDTEHDNAFGDISDLFKGR